MAARLKVFTWSDGFHAFTVAASSRPTALEAWGSRQDLFATGLASELSGGPDYEAALAAPGEVIQRGQAIDVGKIAKAPRPKKAAGPSRARQDKIARLEAEVEKLDLEAQSTLQDIDDQIELLTRQRAEAEKDHDARRRALTAQLKEARA